MRALVVEQEKARKLRLQGYSVKEIAREINVSKGSVSIWVRDVPLSESARARILTRIQKGQFISAENNKARTRSKEERYLTLANERLRRTRFDTDTKAFLCGAMYWCEGTKSPRAGVTFINSDPSVIRKFLELFRASFKLREEKFKPLLHLHRYHDVQMEIDFWSKITYIKKSQFKKPYIKPNTGKRIRDGYRGCLSLRYYDTDIARQLLALGKALLDKN